MSHGGRPIPTNIEGLLGILYTCKLCGEKDREVSMKYRTGDENVVDWLEKKVIVVVAKDHRARAPWCRGAAVDLKIPLPPGTTFVGGPVVN